MHIKKISYDKHNLMNLFLLADPDEKMVKKYIAKSDVFVLYDKDKILGECAVMQLAPHEYEIKNLAIEHAHQKMGYGRKLVEYVCKFYEDATVIVGTSEGGIRFYEKCGFELFSKIENFFIDNYAESVYDNGKLCDHMYILKYCRCSCQ